MVVPAPSAPPTSPGPSGLFAVRSENLASTLKWLVASSGAVAVAVVAGLQLTSLQDLQPWAAAIAVLGAVIALVSVGATLFGAARVLAVDTPTVTELSNEELDANHASAMGTAPLSPLITWIHERRTLLLGEAPTITSLYADGIVGTRRSLDDLKRRLADPSAPRSWRKQRASLELLQEHYAAASAQIERIEAAAGYWVRRDAYVKLMRKAKWLSGFFLVGILMFALIPVWGRATPVANVKDPIPAQIYVRDAATAGVPATCPSVLSGQIVGGSLDRPTIVTAPSEHCPALRLSSSDEALIVVPQASSSQR